MPYSLTSDTYIPQYTIDKFNQVTNLLKESGLGDLYESFYIFWARAMYESIRSDSANEFQPITFSEFYSLLVLCFCFLVFSLFVLIFEIIWFHFEKKMLGVCARGLTPIQYL